MASDAIFDKGTLRFLTQLAANNEREWFAANKSRYEAHVRDPALDYIAAMQAPLAKFAPAFRAIPERVGGSLMRVYRDTRFARDKTPFKTNIGIQFRHTAGKDVHAPGYYVHIAPGDCFLAAGMWHPEPSALTAIRDRIVAQPDAWRRVLANRPLREHFELQGDSLKRPPRGYAADHEHAADLRRKDFIAVHALTAADITSPDFVSASSKLFAGIRPLMQFLCTAVGVEF